MEILEGKPVSGRIDDAVREMLDGMSPRLSVYLTGSDRSSLIYARSKVRKGERLGMEVLLKQFPDGASEKEILSSIAVDSKDPTIQGIMIERPLSEGLDLERIMKSIPASKDVEGLHPENLGRLITGKPSFIPPTPLGAVLMLRHYSVETSGKRVLVVGRSPNVGRPVSILLSMKRNWGNSTVTLAHSRTGELTELTSEADIIISAVGRAGYLKGSDVKDGSVIIDLGINPLPDGSITGDADLSTMEEMDVKVTPTPGGTGPVTVSSMFLNLAFSHCRNSDREIDCRDPMISEIYG